MLELARKVEGLALEGRPFVLVTLTGIKGSAPQVEGAKMLVTSEGLHWGTVGGGKIEAHCIRYAREQLELGAAPHARSWNLQRDIGMSCGGEVSLFFDTHQGALWRIAIFGAGHISQELCRVLQGWSCRVSVFDTRAEWLERLPKGGNIVAKLSQSLEAEVASLPAGTYLLSMTQGHDSDLPVLRKAFADPGRFPLLGVIGSQVKAVRLRRELVEGGIQPAEVERLACPLGLPLGNNTPAEIAISICAQLLALRDKASFSLEAGQLLPAIAPR